MEFITLDLGPDPRIYTGPIQISPDRPVEAGLILTYREQPPLGTPLDDFPLFELFLGLLDLL